MRVPRSSASLQTDFDSMELPCIFYMTVLITSFPVRNGGEMQCSNLDANKTTVLRDVRKEAAQSQWHHLRTSTLRA